MPGKPLPSPSLPAALQAARSGDRATARHQLQQLIALSPGDARLYYTLGVVEQEDGAPERARDAFAKAVSLAPRLHQAWNNLGLAREDLNDLDGAAAALEQAVAVAPDYLAGLRNLARVLRRLGRWQDARDCYVRITDLDADDWRAKLEARLALPAIHASAEAMLDERRRYAAALDELIGQAESDRAADPRRLAVAGHEHFFLAYQGEDDRPLQENYSRLLGLLLKGLLPTGPSPGAGQPRLRVAFVSSFFRDCTVGNYFGSWITGLDPERFDRRIYSLTDREDAMTEALRSGVDDFLRLPTTLPAAATAILDDAPDVLVYPELGMNGPTYALASQRLARWQCAAWGHPVTSGHANVDYYLSCAAMEPPGADAHYTERLQLLPGLGTRYTMPAVGDDLSRADFELPSDRNLYLCPQSLFKIHPEDDALFAEVLAADPRGLLLVFQGENDWQTRTYLNRLQGALASRGLAAGRVQVMPLMPRPAYLQLNRLADVMLDTGRWSGGNTSLDALAAGLPIVTRWGRFMRGRQSAAMLTLIGVDELVVADAPAYIHLASAIGSDRAIRAKYSDRIVQRRQRLFDDVRPIEALSEFLLALPRQG